jgi:hypothetical protein
VAGAWRLLALGGRVQCLEGNCFLRIPVKHQLVDEHMIKKLGSALIVTIQAKITSLSSSLFSLDNNLQQPTTTFRQIHKI